jgi:hypothetical protein
MRLRITMLGTVLLLAVAVLSGGIGNRNQTQAAVFSCQGTNCPNQSSCTGDHWVQSTCSITCYKDQGVTGQMVFSGSANCGTSAGGGGGTGGGGGGGGGFEGSGYCADNWEWDAACSGPDDSYAPFAGMMQ